MHPNTSRFSHGFEDDAYPRPFSSSGRWTRSIGAFGIALAIMTYSYFLYTWSDPLSAIAMLAFATFLLLLAPLWDAKKSNKNAYELITNASGETEIHVQEKAQFRLWCVRLIMASIALTLLGSRTGNAIIAVGGGAAALALLLLMVLGRFACPAPLILDRHGLHILDTKRWAARARPDRNKKAHRDTVPADYYHMGWDEISAIVPTHQPAPVFQWLREPRRYIDVHYVGHDASPVDPAALKRPEKQRIPLIHYRMRAETVLDLLYLLWLNPEAREHVGDPELLLDRVRPASTESATSV